MTALFYRLSETHDPEERLEDACMWKALHEEYGHGITLLPSSACPPDEGVLFGRTRYFEARSAFVGSQTIRYGDDPGFRWGISRRFETCDLERAEELVAEIHGAGKDAFVKAIDQKLFTSPVRRGQSIHGVLGDLIYSIVDRPGCLMVQDFVQMRHERRFVMINGSLITSSPVAIHLTPLHRDLLKTVTGHSVEDLHFETPSHRTPIPDPGLSRRMERFVEEVARRSAMKNAIIDVAELADGRIEVIEFNPCQPGMFGLFACDPFAIAEATWRLLPEEVAVSVRSRKANSDPAPIPAPQGREAGQERVEGYNGYRSFFDCDDEPYKDTPGL